MDLLCFTLGSPANIGHAPGHCNSARRARPSKRKDGDQPRIRLHSGRGPAQREPSDRAHGLKAGATASPASETPHPNPTRDATRPAPGQCPPEAKHCSRTCATLDLAACVTAAWVVPVLPRPGPTEPPDTAAAGTAAEDIAYPGVLPGGRPCWRAGVLCGRMFHARLRVEPQQAPGRRARVARQDGRRPGRLPY